MLITIYHGNGTNQIMTVFEDWLEAELHYAKMWSTGYAVCGGAIYSGGHLPLVIAGMRDNGRFLMLPLAVDSDSQPPYVVI